MNSLLAERLAALRLELANADIVIADNISTDDELFLTIYEHEPSDAVYSVRITLSDCLNALPIPHPAH